MSESKITFHAPITRDPSAAREIIPVPPAGMQVVPARSDPRAGSGAEQGMNAQFVLHALRRWWKIALPSALILAAIAVAVVCLLFVPQYEASALLEISEHPQYIAFAPSVGASTAYFRTQMEIIRSRWILGRAVANEKIKQMPEIRKQQDPIEWLKKWVKVVSANGSDVFEIKYSCANPENAALVVNEITTQYLTAQEEEEAKRGRDIVAALTREMQSREKDVRTLRTQVQTATQQVSGKEPELTRPDQNFPARNPLGELQNRLITLQVEHAMLSARISASAEELRVAEEAEKASTMQTAAEKAAQSDAATKVAAARSKRKLTAEEEEWRDLTVEREIATNAEVRQLESQLLANKMELERIEKLFKRGTADSLCIKFKEEIAILEKNLKELKERLKSPAQEQADLSLRARRLDAVLGVNSVNGVSGEGMFLARSRAELARMHTELRSYEIAEDNLRLEYKNRSQKFLKELEQLGADNVNLTFMKDELAEKQKVLERITERQIALETERAAPPRVIWHEPARIPEAPVEAWPYKQLALAGLLALCLPFALAVGWERVVRRIGGSEELEQHLHLTVLGEISRLPTRIPAASGSAEARIGLELRVFQESIDSLRTALTLSGDLRDMRILAIASAVNHEGKTSIASQLALSLARATGKMTLLIDGDMRSPDVHKVFDVPQGPGLAEVLSHECPLADAIATTHNERVHLLPAGRLKVNPHRLLGNGEWKSLLAQIPDSYGYVVIDTPPVLAASEALVLAQAADATLLCAMRDVSRADQVRKAAGRLLSAGGRPVGTVLSGVPTSHYTYRNGTYPSPAAPSDASN